VLCLLLLVLPVSTLPPCPPPHHRHPTTYGEGTHVPKALVGLGKEKKAASRGHAMFLVVPEGCGHTSERHGFTLSLSTYPLGKHHPPCRQDVHRHVPRSLRGIGGGLLVASSAH
jgi:hypothetical protein